MRRVITAGKATSACRDGNRYYRTRRFVGRSRRLTSLCVTSASRYAEEYRVFAFGSVLFRVFATANNTSAFSAAETVRESPIGTGATQTRDHSPALVDEIEQKGSVRFIDK